MNVTVATRSATLLFTLPLAANVAAYAWRLPDGEAHVAETFFSALVVMGVGLVAVGWMGGTLLAMFGVREARCDALRGMAMAAATVCAVGFCAVLAAAVAASGGPSVGGVAGLAIAAAYTGGLGAIMVSIVATLMEMRFRVVAAIMAAQTAVLTAEAVIADGRLLIGTSAGCLLFAAAVARPKLKRAGRSS